MNKMMIVGCLLSLALTGCLSCGTSSHVEIKNGDKISWLGDSITYEAFADRRDGFMQVCHRAFASNGVDVVCARAGVPGNRSSEMLKRMDLSVLNRTPDTKADYAYLKDPQAGIETYKDKKPTILVLSCGVNDVGHQQFEGEKYLKGGVLLPAYKENVTKIIDQAQAAGLKVIILTQTMIGEDATALKNKVLASYNDFLRAIAKEKGCVLVDVNAQMQKEVAAFRATAKPNAKRQYPNYMLRDGLHPNGRGHRMMAKMILTEAFGFTPEQLAKAGVQ